MRLAKGPAFAAAGHCAPDLLPLPKSVRKSKQIGHSSPAFDQTPTPLNPLILGLLSIRLFAIRNAEFSQAGLFAASI